LTVVDFRVREQKVVRYNERVSGGMLVAARSMNTRSLFVSVSETSLCEIKLKLQYQDLTCDSLPPSSLHT